MNDGAHRSGRPPTDDAIEPGFEVRGVFGALVGMVDDVADNAILVSSPERRFWLQRSAVLRTRARCVTLQCPAKFAASYRLA